MSKRVPVSRAASGPRRTNLDELARLLGVSRATVSNAYNRPDQLSPALREKILEKATALGYPGPNPAARSLRHGVVSSIGVVLTETLSYAFSDGAAVEFLNGLARRFESAGVSLLLIPASPRREATAVRYAIVDGFVVYSMPDDDQHVEAVLHRRLPSVFVDQPEMPGHYFVRIDNRGACREIAEHVLSHGHRRVGVVSFACRSDGYQGLADMDRQASATRQVTRERLSGYRDAISAAGIDWSGVTVEECRRSDEDEGRQAGMVLLSTQPRPTAILAMSDHLALGVLAAARDLGLAVPGDLSLVGFDDVARAGLTGLTTVRQPLVEKGTAAAELLLTALAGRHVDPSERVLPTELVIRESVGPPA